MNRDPIPFPRAHAPDCQCGSCFVQSWKRAAETPYRPMNPHRESALPDRSAELKRIAAALGPQPSLIERFRAAALPGDFAALLLGTQLGVALAAVAILVNHRHLIASAIASLW